MSFCERNIPLCIIYQDKKLSRKNRSGEKIDYEFDFRHAKCKVYVGQPDKKIE